MKMAVLPNLYPHLNVILPQAFCQHCVPILLLLLKARLCCKLTKFTLRLNHPLPLSSFFKNDDIRLPLQACAKTNKS